MVIWSKAKHPSFLTQRIRFYTPIFKQPWHRCPNTLGPRRVPALWEQQGVGRTQASARAPPPAPACRRRELRGPTSPLLHPPRRPPSTLPAPPTAASPNPKPLGANGAAGCQLNPSIVCELPPQSPSPDSLSREHAGPQERPSAPAVTPPRPLAHRSSQRCSHRKAGLTAPTGQGEHKERSP